LADLIAEESWAHERWRRWKRLPDLALHVSERVEPIIDAWRAPAAAVPAHVGSRTTVHDPTRWTTEDLIKDVRENPLEPAP